MANNLFRSLGVLNVSLGLIVSILALLLSLGVFAWPFEGDMPLLGRSIAMYFIITIFAFIIIGLPLKSYASKYSQVNTNARLGGLVFLIKMTAVVIAGGLHLGVMSWGWINGFQEREWLLWLLLPAVFGMLAMFWVVIEADTVLSRKAQSEGGNKKSGVEYTRADIALAAHSLFGTVMRAAIIGIAPVIILISGILMFAVCRNVMVEVFFFDYFVGWDGLSKRVGDLAMRLWPHAAFYSAIAMVISIASQLYHHFSVRAVWRLRAREVGELNEARVALINATVDSLEASVPKIIYSKFQYIIMVSAFIIFGAVIITVVFMTSLWPIYLAVETGGGIGHQLFKPARVAGIGVFVFSDHIGGFEIALSAASLTFAYYGLTRVMRAYPLLWMWSWSMSDVPRRRAQYMRAVVEGVLAGAIKRPEDFSLEQVGAFAYRPFEPACIVAAAACFVGALLLWPLDRLHYGVISERAVVDGHYYFPGSVRSYQLDQINVIKRECRRDRDAIVQWQMELPNGVVVPLLTAWKQADERQKKMLISVGHEILKKGPDIIDNVDVAQCGQILEHRFGEDAVSVAPLFGLSVQVR